MTGGEAPPSPFAVSSPYQDPLRRFLIWLFKWPLGKVLGLHELGRLYEQHILGDEDIREFVEKGLAALRVSYEVPPEQVQRIPREGPLIVVANHPFSVIESLLLIHLLHPIRQDVKVMANFILQRMAPLQGSIICVDPFARPESARLNVAPIRESIAWVKSGGLLVIFPAGEVSHLNLKRGVVCDGPWAESVARVIRRTQAPVLPAFFNGRNGALFQLAGLIHPRLRTALLPRVFLKLRGKTLHLRIGRPIPVTKLDSIADDTDMMSYLRMATYLLRDSGPMQAARSRVRHSHREQPLIDPIAADLLVEDLAGLGEDERLLASGEYEVWCAAADRIPNVLLEIGRLRELTFRRVGEGGGQPHDVDPFDYHYFHLFVWNTKNREVVGAYRLGPTDRILPEQGPEGLFTSRYYTFAEPLLKRINPALELGNSFVRPEYQKHHSPMALLWNGIGAFIGRHPQYNTLVGMVSISSDYRAVSRRMILAFLKAHHYLPDLGKSAKPKHPPDLRLSGELRDFDRLVTDIEEVSALVSAIEPDGKGVPVLLRQYLRLNAKLLSCNILPTYSQMWAGLMLADLTGMHPRILERHMGKEGAIRFLEYHRQERQAGG
ncbi:MAG: lysophospholipid acyltransferase family protein [Planctomycetes bacterium]|nr:lysophospholipid acyltransferase family protein [Planctomycetota bacterium]